MRMSREVKITMMYGFGDQGKNYSTMLFYRVIADYSLISRLMNVITYSSSDTISPKSIFNLMFCYRLLLMSDLSTFLVVPSSSIAKITRVEKKSGWDKSLAGHAAYNRSVQQGRLLALT